MKCTNFIVNLSKITRLLSWVLFYLSVHNNELSLETNIYSSLSIKILKSRSSQLRIFVCTFKHIQLIIELLILLL